MFPIPPIGLAIAALFFLARSNLAGVFLGMIVTLAVMHLWPGAMDAPYQWVGQIIDALGIREIMGNTSTGETEPSL